MTIISDEFDLMSTVTDKQKIQQKFSIILTEDDTENFLDQAIEYSQKFILGRHANSCALR